MSHFIKELPLRRGQKCDKGKRCHRCMNKLKELGLNPAKKQLPWTTLSGTRMPFGEYKGYTFDEIPLAYLDWLAGEPEMRGGPKEQVPGSKPPIYVDNTEMVGGKMRLYGKFAERLWAYLRHEHVQRELAEMFPICLEVEPPGKDGELFVTDESVQQHIRCTMRCPRKHRWHGQPHSDTQIPNTAFMPEHEEHEATFNVTPRKVYPNQQKIWDLAVDYLLMLEQPEATPQEKIKLPTLRMLVKHLPKEVSDKLRAAYANYRKVFINLEKLPGRGRSRSLNNHKPMFNIYRQMEYDRLCDNRHMWPRGMTL